MNASEKLNKAFPNTRLYKTKIWNFPYSFQPLARQYVKDLKELTRVQKEARDMIAAKNSEKALSHLDQFRKSARPFAYNEINKVKAEARKGLETERAEQEQQFLADRKLHLEKVQKDLDQIDEIRGVNLRWMLKNDFRKAEAAVVELQKKLQTDEGRESLQLLRDGYSRMGDLKRFLIASIRAQPGSERHHYS